MHVHLIFHKLSILITTIDYAILLFSYFVYVIQSKIISGKVWNNKQMIMHSLVKMNALGQIGLSSYFLQIIKTSFENIFQMSLYHKFNQM